MQQYINSAKVKRNARLARILSFGGLAVMGLGLLISFRPPYRIDLVLGLFLVGILASQIGLPMRNRWDRRPRIDEILDGALKGLDQRFAIFHYSLGARHVLVCPGGVFAVIPRVENGLIRSSDGLWTRTIRVGRSAAQGQDRFVAPRARFPQKSIEPALISTCHFPCAHLSYFSTLALRWTIGRVRSWQPTSRNLNPPFASSPRLKPFRSDRSSS